MRRALLQAFAAQLHSDDEVVIEATGNAAAVAEVIGPSRTRFVA
jgi:transposase